MSRLTRKELAEIRRAYHMDLPREGGCRFGAGVAYACHIYVEKLVEEVEACWRDRRKRRIPGSGTLC